MNADYRVSQGISVEKNHIKQVQRPSHPLSCSLVGGTNKQFANKAPFGLGCSPYVPMMKNSEAEKMLSECLLFILS